MFLPPSFPLAVSTLVPVEWGGSRRWTVKTNPTRKREIAGWFLQKAGEAPVLHCRGVGPPFYLYSQLSCIVLVLSFNFHCFSCLPGTFLSFCACHQNTERHFPQSKRQVSSNYFRKQIRIFRAYAVIGIFFTCYWEEDTSAAVDINSTYPRDCKGNKGLGN